LTPELSDRLNALSSSSRYDVAIVGGGITGCATAYQLSREGARVVLLDRHEIGSEGSGRNAGSLHGQIQHPPFVELGETWARSFLPALAFLQESLTIWAGLSEELGEDLEVKTHGGLLLVDNPVQMKLVERKVAIERAAGIDSRVLARDELLEFAPYLGDAMIGAEYCPVEGKANPMLATAAYARMAASFGTDILARTVVLSIEPSAHEIRLVTNSGHVSAEQVVLASGDELSIQARSFGLRLPITTEPVQVSATEPVTPLINHLLYFAGQRLTLKQARTGSLLIGGGWPARLSESGYPLVDLGSLRANLAVALHAVPMLGPARVVRSWAGIGNGTPDHRPIIGTIPGQPRLHVGIFPHMGFTAGPLMGRVLADSVLGRSPSFDLGPFRVDRFSNF
jgi:sarcosine oxidase subunit beta